MRVCVWVGGWVCTRVARDRSIGTRWQEGWRLRQKLEGIKSWAEYGYPANSVVIKASGTFSWLLLHCESAYMHASHQLCHSEGQERWGSYGSVDASDAVMMARPPPC